MILEEGPLSLGLDTLRDHVEVEALGQREDGLDLRRVLRVVGQPGDERSVDLEGLEAELADPRDGEEARPEVVEGQLDAKTTQSPQPLRHLGTPGHDGVLGKVQLKSRSGQTACLERLLHLGDEVGLQELTLGEVDDQASVPGKGRREASGHLQRPGPDGKDEPALLGLRDEA